MTSLKKLRHFWSKNIFYNDVINLGINVLKTLGESLPVCKIWTFYYFWFRS